MIKFEQIEVWGIKHAIRGMRNPLNSWERSDTVFDGDKMCLGENDVDLMTRLIHGGAPHRKFLRQIFVSVDITAPLYWWKEFDTYKVGTTANSCSTMHKIQAKELRCGAFVGVSRGFCAWVYVCMGSPFPGLVAAFSGLVGTPPEGD